MALQDKLRKMREASKARVPEEARIVMQRADADLRASGIIDAIIKPSAAAPTFSLPDAHGKTISLGGLLKQGWLILSFYRGVW